MDEAEESRAGSLPRFGNFHNTMVTVAAHSFLVANQHFLAEIGSGLKTFDQQIREKERAWEAKTEQLLNEKRQAEEEAMREKKRAEEKAAEYRRLEGLLFHKEKVWEEERKNLERKWSAERRQLEEMVIASEERNRSEKAVESGRQSSRKTPNKTPHTLQEREKERVWETQTTRKEDEALQRYAEENQRLMNRVEVMTQRCRKAHQYLREYYKRFKQIQGAVGSSQAHSMWDTSDFDANQMSDEGESSEESEDEEWTEEVKKKKGKKEKEVPLTQAPKVDDSKRKPFHAEDIHETSKTSARPPPRRSLPPTLVPSRALRLPHASHLPPQLVSPKGHSLALLKTSPPSVSSSSSETKASSTTGESEEKVLETQIVSDKSTFAENEEEERVRETQFIRNDKEEERVADTQPAPTLNETEGKERGDKIDLTKPQRKRRIEFTDMLPFEDTSIPPPKTSPQKRRKVDSDPPKAEISNAKKIEQKEMFRTGQEKGKEKGDKDTLVKGEESQSAFPDHYCANCVEYSRTMEENKRHFIRKKNFPQVCPIHHVGAAEFWKVPNFFGPAENA